MKSTPNSSAQLVWLDCSYIFKFSPTLAVFLIGKQTGCLPVVRPVTSIQTYVEWALAFKPTKLYLIKYELGFNLLGTSTKFPWLWRYSCFLFKVRYALEWFEITFVQACYLPDSRLSIYLCNFSMNYIFEVRFNQTLHPDGKYTNP